MAALQELKAEEKIFSHSKPRIRFTDEEKEMIERWQATPCDVAYRVCVHDVAFLSVTWPAGSGKMTLTGLTCPYLR